MRPFIFSEDDRRDMREAAEGLDPGMLSLGLDRFLDGIAPRPEPRVRYAPRKEEDWR